MPALVKFHAMNILLPLHFSMLLFVFVASGACGAGGGGVDSAVYAICVILVLVVATVAIIIVGKHYRSTITLKHNARHQ